MPNFTPKLEDTLASILEYLSSQGIAMIFNVGIGIGGTRVCIPASSLTNRVTLVKTHTPQCGLPRSHYSHLCNGYGAGSHLSGIVLWALVKVIMFSTALRLAHAKGWISSYYCYCGCHRVDRILHSGSRDNVSTLSSQPEGSLQSWLSCTLSLATDTARTTSRQSAISSRTLSPR